MNNNNLRMENTSRDWSSLPADLINKMAELLSLPLRIWIRMVCKSWCSAIPPIHIPTPWLLLPGDGPEYGEYTDSFTFYSILTNTTFKCPFPPDFDLSGMHCVGTQSGWLVMCDPYFELILVDPLTEYRKYLLPFSSSPYFKAEYSVAEDGSEVLSGFRDRRNGGPEGRMLRNFDRRECYIKKVAYTAYPGHEDFAVMALYGAGKLAFVRDKDTAWRGFNRTATVKIVDIAVYYDSFWALTAEANIIRIKLSRKDTFGLEDARIPYEPIYNTHKFIVFDSADNLYLILRNGDFQMHADGKKKFCTRDLTVMKLNNPWKPIDGMPHKQWVQAEDLNGHSLYIGNNSGFYLLAGDSPQMRPNCVYVTSILNKDEIFDMGVYDMENKRFESIYPNDSELNWSQPPLIWFDPRLMHQ